MWCVFWGFVGGLVAAPVLAVGGRPIVKRVVMGGIVVGDTVNDWAHERRNDWRNVVRDAKTELRGRRPVTTREPIIVEEPAPSRRPSTRKSSRSTARA